MESQPTTSASGWASATRRATLVAFAAASAGDLGPGRVVRRGGEEGGLVDVGDLDERVEPGGPQHTESGGGGGGEHEAHATILPGR